MTPDEQRAQIVAVARSWLGTKYAHRGRAKGKNGGVDCAQFVYLVFRECGLCPEMPLTEYTGDFFMHRGIEEYMKTVLEYCRPAGYPEPGDIALFKIGRLFAHGGVVTRWPSIVHADRPSRIVTEERTDSGRLAGRQAKFFSRL
jgi:cell wall-associated NlpC family hydrolase